MKRGILRAKKTRNNTILEKGGLGRKRELLEIPIIQGVHKRTRDHPGRGREMNRLLLRQGELARTVCKWGEADRQKKNSFGALGKERNDLACREIGGGPASTIKNFLLLEGTEGKGG